MCKLVHYAKLLFDINAAILFHVHQVLLLYVLAFAHHFACTYKFISYVLRILIRFIIQLF